MTGITYTSTELALLELEEHGRDAGLAPEVLPLLAALSVLGDPLDETDLRRIASATALTRADTDAFVERVKGLPFWSHGRLEVSLAGRIRGAFLRFVLGLAEMRGLAVRVKAGRPIDRLATLLALDRDLADAGTDARLCHWLAAVLPTHDLHLDVGALPSDQVRPGGLLGCLALRVAERAAPACPVPTSGPARDSEHAEALLALAGHRAREVGADAALDPAREAVRLYRALVAHASHYQADLDEALRLLEAIGGDPGTTLA